MNYKYPYIYSSSASVVQRDNTLQLVKNPSFDFIPNCYISIPAVEISPYEASWVHVLNITFGVTNIFLLLPIIYLFVITLTNNREKASFNIVIIVLAVELIGVLIRIVVLLLGNIDILILLSLQRSPNNNNDNNNNNNDDDNDSNHDNNNN